MLAGAAGAIGWWLTSWSVRTWEAITESRYQVRDYAVGSGTVAYLVAISLAAVLAFLILPLAFHAPARAAGCADDA